MGRYKQGVVQWPKKSWKGCEKKVWNCKKGVKYEKKKNSQNWLKMILEW